MGSEETRRAEEVRRSEEERPPLLLRLEEELRELAASGRTRELLGLLEEGAPFVVDMVGV